MSGLGREQPPSPRSGADAPSSTSGDPVDQVVADIRTLIVQMRQRMARSPINGSLLLSQPDCQRLEDTLGLGATQTVETLVKAVERLASMKIGDIRIPFTPGQLAELQHRASKRGRTVEAEMRAVVARIEDELFYQGA